MDKGRGAGMECLATVQMHGRHALGARAHQAWQTGTGGAHHPATRPHTIPLRDGIHPSSGETVFADDDAEIVKPFRVDEPGRNVRLSLLDGIYEITRLIPQHIVCLHRFIWRGMCVVRGVCWASGWRSRFHEIDRGGM